MANFSKQFGVKLKGAIKRKGFTQEAFANKLGFTLSGFNHILGGNVPNGLLLKRMADELEVTTDYLLSGEGEMQTTTPSSYPIPDNGAPPRTFDEDFAHIPLYDVRAEAGGGAFVDSEDIEEILAFRKDWIINELQVKESDLAVLFVQGDSMTPTLNPGDIMLIVKDNGDAIKDGIYVIRLEGGLLVKRLQKLPGGVIKVISDNRAYDPYEISDSTKHNGFSIIGRVVWAGRRF